MGGREVMARRRHTRRPPPPTPPAPQPKPRIRRVSANELGDRSRVHPTSVGGGEKNWSGYLSSAPNSALPISLQFGMGNLTGTQQPEAVLRPEPDCRASLRERKRPTLFRAPPCVGDANLRCIKQARNLSGPEADVKIFKVEKVALIEPANGIQDLGPEGHERAARARRIPPACGGRPISHFVVIEQRPERGLQRTRALTDHDNGRRG